MGKRKRSSSQHDDEAVDAEEAARRQKQRELRELALKLRAKGTEYNKKKHRLGKTDTAAPGKAKGRQKVQVAVIPIFWKQRPEEQQRVLEAARSVRDLLLEKLGVGVVVDEGNVKTPGQKMRAWEERGVKVRVEIGPSEAIKRTCILAKVKSVGQVASKQSMAVGPKLIERLQDWLGAGQEESPKQDENTAPAAIATGAADNEKPDVPQGKKRKSKKSEGQKSEGDAGEAVEDGQGTHGHDADGTDNGDTKKKKKSKKAKAHDAVDEDVAHGQAEAAVDGGAENGHAKKKKKKLQHADEGITEQAATKKKKKLKHVEDDKIQLAEEDNIELATATKKGSGLGDSVAGADKEALDVPEAKRSKVKSPGTKGTTHVHEGIGDEAGDGKADEAGLQSEEGVPAGAAKSGSLYRSWVPKAEFVSGDALEDDFGEIEVEAEEDLQLSKKERFKVQKKKEKLKKKERKAAASGRDGDEGGQGDRSPALPKAGAKLKPKVVTF